MKIILEELLHQKEAIEKILKLFECVDIVESKNDFQNPFLNGVKDFDIQMETGTGKTYTYLKMIFELNERFNLRKFIILTPSVAIKEGTKNFINADYSREHFKNLYGNNVKLNSINAGDFDNKRRKFFPADLCDFCESTRQSKEIQVLLLNTGMLTSRSMAKNDYDSSLFNNITCPLEAIKETRPVVIIDEPHKFNKKNKAFKIIKNEIKPQLIVRFGATFPDDENNNIIYKLGSVEAFNQNLIKAIDIHYANDENSNNFRVKKVNDKELEITSDNKRWNIKDGESLSVLSEKFNGIDFIGGNKSLSNDLELQEGMILSDNIFSIDYQKTMIRIALDKHFEQEKENFNRDVKIKTLSLFFIDSVKSYRGDNNTDGWLKKEFKILLSEKIKELIKVEKGEYKEFLEESLKELDECMGGYFARDNGEKEVEKEVDDILRNKDKLLSFKENGKWVLRRFLFSKWTLKEGWDNPNVFVIAKLRKSGSDISKIQEVGRGLRLPVNENGNRISSEEFRLSYIIDYSEKDFADKLKSEINLSNQVKLEGQINMTMINNLVDNKYGINQFDVMNKLKLDNIIDDNMNIIDSSKLEDLLSNCLKKDKIIVNSNSKKKTIKLKKDNWQKIKDLWLDITKRYMLKYKANVDIEEIVEKSLLNNFIDFEYNIYKNTMNLGEDINFDLKTYNIKSNQKISYGEFLIKLNKATSIPIKLWHKAILKLNPDEAKFNNSSFKKIIISFNDIFVKSFEQSYEYCQLDFTASTTIFKNNEFVDEIAQNLLGDRKIIGKTENNFLYDQKCFDSDIEKEILNKDINETKKY